MFLWNCQNFKQFKYFSRINKELSTDEQISYDVLGVVASKTFNFLHAVELLPIPQYFIEEQGIPINCFFRRNRPSAAKFTTDTTNDTNKLFRLLKFINWQNCDSLKMFFQQMKKNDQTNQNKNVMILWKRITFLTKMY